MPIDPTGTSPGLAKTAPPEPVLNLKCRDMNCNSMQATEIKVGGPEHTGQRMYRCIKCGYVWGVNLGGHLGI
jgi:transposase-like protein